MVDYNSKNIQIFIDDNDINSGLVKDTFCSITYDNPLIVRHLDTKGTAGETSNTNDLSATVKITCLQGSYANNLLLKKHLENIQNDNGSFRLKIVDTNLGLIFEASEADVEKFTDFNMANEEQNREWTIITTRLALTATPDGGLSNSLKKKYGNRLAEKAVDYLANELLDLI